ncbi:MAG TPA: hypothetical protein DDZ51_29270 [Planctomycetaceae bacterium]|nr:hypothetical protein [Planctomycetaceae bacterium]
MTVENASLQSATSWGIKIKSAQEVHHWKVASNRVSLTDGTCIRGQQQTFLSSEKKTLVTHLLGEAPAGAFRPVASFCDLADDSAAIIRSLSQNYVGKDVRYAIVCGAGWLLTG